MSFLVVSGAPLWLFLVAPVVCPSAAVVAGVAFALGGFGVARTLFVGVLSVCAWCVIFARGGGVVCAGDCRSLLSSCLSGGIFPIFLRVFLLSLSSPVGFWPFGFFVVPQSGILVGPLGGVWEGRCPFFLCLCVCRGPGLGGTACGIVCRGWGRYSGPLRGRLFSVGLGGRPFCFVFGVGALVGP